VLDILQIAVDHRKADLPFRGTVTPVKETVFSGAHDGLGRARLLEDIFMVSAGIRKAALMHPFSEVEVLWYHELASELGLGMAVRKAGSRVLKVYVSGMEKENIIRRIPDLDESMGTREFIIAQIALANLTGEVLGYPQCCVSSFVRHLMDATDQDEGAMEALKVHPAPDPRAYFVDRFVPCRPDCPGAVKEGKRLDQELQRVAPELLPEYREVRKGHMEDVRSGAIVREKKDRDRAIEHERPVKTPSVRPK